MRTRCRATSRVHTCSCCQAAGRGCASSGAGRGHTTCCPPSACCVQGERLYSSEELFSYIAKKKREQLPPQVALLRGVAPADTAASSPATAAAAGGSIPDSPRTPTAAAPAEALAADVQEGAQEGVQGPWQTPPAQQQQLPLASKQQQEQQPGPLCGGAGSGAAMCSGGQAGGLYDLPRCSTGARTCGVCASAWVGGSQEVQRPIALLLLATTAKGSRHSVCADQPIGECHGQLQCRVAPEDRGNPLPHSLSSHSPPPPHPPCHPPSALSHLIPTTLPTQPPTPHPTTLLGQVGALCEGPPAALRRPLSGGGICSGAGGSRLQSFQLGASPR